MSEATPECEIQWACDRPEALSEDWLRQCLVLALRGSKAGLTLRLVGEEEMLELNREHRGKAGTTNVLSFPAEYPPEVEIDYLGDMAICAAVVAREAHEQNKDLRHHWAHMVVHGVLHLRGYDHIDPEESEEMEAFEVALLAQLGIANPYE